MYRVYNILISDFCCICVTEKWDKGPVTPEGPMLIKFLDLVVLGLNIFF